MDGLARKRKVDTDADDDLAAPWPGHPTPDTSSFLLAPPSAHSPKRPRIEQAATRKLARVHYKAPSRPPLSRSGSDSEDTGVVHDQRDHQPSPTLLFRRQIKPTTTSIDPNSPHIPSLLPTINRQTLKELDLNHIFRNPQLCHDILFDPGLQFRPNSLRKKRDQSEKYWNAVQRELEMGCTCVSFDQEGKLYTGSHCVCRDHGAYPDKPTLVHTQKLAVVRMPSRVLPLLREFLEVLLLVIQPLSGVSALYVNPDMFKAQRDEHASQAAYIQNLFDPELIEQELRRGVFDPSGLFQIITSTLRAHCAPMRDASMEAMIQCAREARSLAEAVNAMKMCMEMLELMKLDIANHQLQAIRPHLTRNSAEIELRRFLKSRKQLTVTKAWLRKAIPESIPDNRQILLGVLQGLTNLVFYPLSSPESYPETLQLDLTRLNHYASEARTVCKLQLYLLLFRQLYLPLQPSSAAVSELKTEIRAIGIENVDQVVLQIVRKFSKGPLPNQDALNMATHWGQSHIVSTSSLSDMLRKRVEASVLETVIALSPLRRPGELQPVPDPSVEPVRAEIATLSEKVARLAQVHLNVYLPIYERDGFFC